MITNVMAEDADEHYHEEAQENSDDEEKIFDQKMFRNRRGAVPSDGLVDWRRLSRWGRKLV